MSLEVQGRHYLHNVSLTISCDALTHNLIMNSSVASLPYGQLHSQCKAIIHNVRKYFLEEWANELWRLAKHMHKNGQHRVQQVWFDSRIY